MYGLVNKSIQSFVENMHGPCLWDAIVMDAGVEPRDFEAMLDYPDDTTDILLEVVAKHLRSDLPSVLEDLGTFLIVHPSCEVIRRLLRFGGHSFDEFLHSLDDLHGRIHLAVPDLELPDLEMREFTSRNLALVVRWRKAGFGSVFLGVIRAMADDYGALVVLDHEFRRIEEGCEETIRIDVLESQFSEGRDFRLAQTDTGSVA